MRVALQLQFYWTMYRRLDGAAQPRLEFARYLLGA